MKNDEPELSDRSTLAQSFHPWETLAEVGIELTVAGVTVVEGGVEVTLGTLDNTYEGTCTFESYIALRRTDSRFRSRTWAGGSRPPSAGAIYVVEDSKWLEWLEKESCTVLEHWPLLHWVICSDEVFIDIVVHEDFPPILAWIRQPG